ncbi:MAG: hypothetical protein WDW36_006432 [Sanguina aurantia]
MSTGFSRPYFYPARSSVITTITIIVLSNQQAAAARYRYNDGYQQDCPVYYDPGAGYDNSADAYGSLSSVAPTLPFDGMTALSYNSSLYGNTSQASHGRTEDTGITFASTTSFPPPSGAAHKLQQPSHTLAVLAALACLGLAYGML